MENGFKSKKHVQLSTLVHPFRVMLAHRHHRSPIISGLLAIALTVPVTWICGRPFLEFHLEHLHVTVYAGRQKVIVVIKVVRDQGGKVGEPTMLNWKITMPTAGRSAYRRQGCHFFLILL